MPPRSGAAPGSAACGFCPRERSRPLLHLHEVQVVAVRVPEGRQTDLDVIDDGTAKRDAARLEVFHHVIERLGHRETDLNGAAASRLRAVRTSRGMQADRDALTEINPGIFIAPPSGQR